VRFALGQINPTIGDFDGNRRLVWEAAREAERRGADLAIFPELALSGYPPKDLLERPAFLDAALACLEALAADLAAAELRVCDSDQLRRDVLVTEESIARTRGKRSAPSTRRLNEE